MGRVDGKAAFITEVARGMGRSHASRLAQEGADVIAVDLCEPLDWAPSTMPAPEDLEDTARQIRALAWQIYACRADMRGHAALERAAGAGVKAVDRSSARLPECPHPTEIPQVRAAAALPTGFPHTKRHSPAQGGTPARVAL
jgi:NAD(P)-dependent dehydrogenase (short-subunit alcohol dehydrogenase family)